MTQRQNLHLKFLTAFAFVVTVGMWANLLYYAWFPAPLRWTYPDDTFEAVQVSRFSDFYDMVYLNRDRDPYNTRKLPPLPPPHFRGTAYPPLANVSYYLFSKFDIDYGGTTTDGPSKAQDKALWLFLGIPFLSFPILVLFWLKPKMPWLTVLLLLIAFNLSYPMLFAIDRGNLELYVFLLLTIFAWLSNSNSKTGRNVATAALGIAGALKIYPLIFILIFFKERRWKAALGVCTICGVLTLLAYFCLRGGFSHNFSANYEFIRGVSDQKHADLRWETRYSSSLFSLLFLSVKAIICSEKGALWIQEHFSAILAVFLAGSCGALFFRRLTFGRFFAAVCCLAILATPESPDYKLLLLIPASIAIVAEGAGGRIFNLLFVSIISLLLIPKNWVMIFDEVSYGSIANPFLVFSFLLLLILAPTDERPTGIGLF